MHEIIQERYRNCRVLSGVVRSKKEGLVGEVAMLSTVLDRGNGCPCFIYFCRHLVQNTISVVPTFNGWPNILAVAFTLTHTLHLHPPPPSNFHQLIQYIFNHIYWSYWGLFCDNSLFSTSYFLYSMNISLFWKIYEKHGKNLPKQRPLLRPCCTIDKER